MNHDVEKALFKAYTSAAQMADDAVDRSVAIKSFDAQCREIRDIYRLDRILGHHFEKESAILRSVLENGLDDDFIVIPETQYAPRRRSASKVLFLCLIGSIASVFLLSHFN